MKPTKTAPTPCSRCYGTGNYARGVCYRCDGRRVDPTRKEWAFPPDWTDDQCRDWNDAREARNAAARHRASEARKALRVSRALKTEIARNKALPARHTLSLLEDQVIDDIMSRPSMTDGQRSFLLSLADRRVTEAIRGKPTLSLGRQDVTATVVKHDTKVTAYGAREVVTLKTPSGAILWGTCPRSLYDAGPGSRVSLTLTVVDSWADGCYRFSRPKQKETHP